MDVGLQQPKTSQFPWVSHPDAVPVEIWETPPAVRRRRGVSHIPTGCRIQLGFYSFKCDKGGIAFRTFKTIVSHPLKEIQENYTEGQILKKLQVKKTFDWGIVYEISHNKRLYEGLLVKGDISHYGWIDSCVNFGSCLNDIPLEIKSIDIEKNRIILS